MVNAARLCAAYRKDLAAAWALYRHKHPDHVPYAFVLWGLESPIKFSAHVLTEQGLSQVAERYVRDGIHETFDEARQALRFSVADSPFIRELLKAMPTVDALLRPYARKIDDKEGYRLQAKAAIRALKSLDKQRLFGVGADRDRLLLCIITEDTEEEWFEPSARQLNRKAALKQMPEKPVGRFASCATMALSPDGKSLYTAGADDSSDDDCDRVIVAYNLCGTELIPRWTYWFPGFGDSVRDIACAPDGKSIVVVRAQYDDGERTTLLMRFAKNKAKPIAEVSFAGEPDSLAISHDGSRIAVSMHSKRVLIFDNKFRRIMVLQIPNACNLVFLRSGPLVVASDGMVRCLGPKTFSTLKSRKLRARHLSLDAAEHRLVVSRWTSLSEIFRPEKEFPLQLFRIPSLTPIRRFRFPRHQAEQAVISSDGRLIAFRSHKIGTHIHHIVVIDAATGREIARRRFELVHEMLFLLDNHTLAIGLSENTPNFPIRFWRLPIASRGRKTR